MKQKIKIGQNGQITIFYSTTILVLITFIAFVINIGIFVKAKINLQNATDAAAWSGASVQARQLTHIGHLNWEMRNVYKEWMFKYYVLGNMSLDTVMNGASGNGATFNMMQAPGAREVDSYNFPSVCLNFATRGTNSINICRIYSVPGLPRFRSSTMPGIEETSTAFINTMVREKSAACADMSQINFLTANTWAYNIPVDEDNAIRQEAPEIARDRWGAFPKAFELAVRIRNLEYQVNRPPFSTGVCYSQTDAAGSCSNDINTLTNGQRLVANERVVKAFYAGYRNLGNDQDDELKRSFTLTEIPPTPFQDSSEYSLSNLLVTQAGRVKHYLDLKLITHNLATFYTNFTTADGDTTSSDTTTLGNVRTEGQCDATKTALPVPGYPMGFVKNPDVLTYYAVKGEATFIGLFNPFDFNGNGIKLTTFAAAKAFGGRIGPMISDVRSDTTRVMARGNSGNKFVTSSYLLGINDQQMKDRNGNNIAASTFVPGAPLPLQEFWLRDIGQSIGGWTTDEQYLRFAIPNIPYDYPGQNPGRSMELLAASRLDLIIPDRSSSNGGITSGAYHPEVFNELRGKLAEAMGGNINGTITPEHMGRAIDLVRAPTLFDAYNYLIPTPEAMNQAYGTEALGDIPGRANDDGVYQVNMYAPLMSSSSDALYNAPGQLSGALNNFLTAQRSAINKYRDAMVAAASSMRNIESISGARTGETAADVVADEPLSCNSMTGKFVFFYTGENAMVPGGGNCPKSLRQLMEEYWAGSLGDVSTFYQMSYSEPTNSIRDKVYSAYRPGPMHDANAEGVFRRSVGSPDPERMWRNFYSTKFVSLKSLFSTSNSYDPATNFTIFSEGNMRNSQYPDISARSFLNRLNPSTIGIDANEINQ